MNTSYAWCHQIHLAFNTLETLNFAFLALLRSMSISYDPFKPFYGPFVVIYMIVSIRSLSKCPYYIKVNLTEIGEPKREGLPGFQVRP